MPMDADSASGDATAARAAGPVTLRLATVADAPRVAELSSQLGYTATPEEIARRLRRLEGDAEHAVYVGVLSDGRVAGWVHVQQRALVQSEAQAEVLGLVVDIAARGCGVGRLLMRQAEEWARSRGCREVVLRSNVVRDRAHVFYERIGYSVFKTQKAFRKAI